MTDNIFDEYFKTPPKPKIIKANFVNEPGPESKPFVLTAENYYSREANQRYMSVSQYKKFSSEYGGCEAAALAELNGEYEPEDKEAFLVGNYVHAWSEGTLEEFKCSHPEIISSKGPTKGELKKEFKVANQMIACLENDPKVMFYLQGLKEVAITAEISGTMWKGRIDVLNNDLNYILDLKTAKSLTEFHWSNAHASRVSFIEEWGYMIQAAVYSEMERLHAGRDTYKDFYIVAVTKQDPPDHQIYNLTDPVRIETELQKIAANLPRILQVKAGEMPPTRCENCAYCRATKKVDKPVFYTELKEAY